MGLLTKPSHVHQCDKCHKPWTHNVYSCNQGEVVDCPTCSGPPPDPKPETSALQALQFWCFQHQRMRCSQHQAQVP